MKAIWKFDLIPFTIGAQILVQIPKRAKILMVDVDERSGDFCVWALVDTEAESERRRIIIYQANSEISNAEILKYINTISDGRFRWHAFEIMAPPLEAIGNENTN